jgi:hypothetical protein
MSETHATDTSLDEIERMMAAEGLLRGPVPTPPESGIEGTDEIIVADKQIVQELDAMIADAGIEAKPEIEASAESDAGGTDEIGDEELEGLVSELAVEEAKQELYASQDGTVDIQEPTEPAKTGKKAKKGGTPVPRISRLANTTAGAYVAAKLNDEEIAAKVDGLPKKVKEKAANLVDFIQTGKSLSVYTQVAIDMLRDRGVITNQTLKDALMGGSKRGDASTGYSAGTAASQAGQMMSLFGKLGIGAPVEGGGLKPNGDNPIWQAIERRFA